MRGATHDTTEPDTSWPAEAIAERPDYQWRARHGVTLRGDGDTASFRRRLDRRLGIGGRKTAIGPFMCLALAALTR